MPQYEFDAASPGSYGFWVDDVIRFSDQDPGGHVNNTAYAAYVEHGRVAIMRGLGIENGGTSRFVLARLEIDYLAEAHFPGRLRVGTRPSRIGNSSIAFRAGVFQDERCLATATSVIVHKSGARAAPLPNAVRAAVEALR